MVYDAFAFLPPPETVSFSPKTWLQRDLQRLEALSLQYPQRRPKPLAFSDGKGLVAGTSSALAVHAGTEALRKGGNAMDACLTTALTEIALAAGSHVSYAGVANILYYDSSTGDTYNLDAGWNKPYYIDPAQIPEHHSGLSNGASVLVPGFIAGVSTASETYGLLPLSKLLEPALYFAMKGFKLPSDLAEEIKKNYHQRSLLST
ncbi:glutathione hydrolase [Desmophyllum pertusum]|uniref:Glutathione hydrolase n=1 Tax=Desmophyllum pertusum TaxID=174260 RepID=A0A9W9ZTJ9_9CNID|nr:glutathione hydrolase [Desmophyllum pertusum]